jgi:hypothetical protein
VSTQGEQEIRESLTGLLDRLEPRPAPVAGTMRRGRGIRQRRLVGAAVGVAVIVAAAALLPGLVQAPRHVSPLGHLHYKVTVQQPDASWPSGTIAAGMSDGHRWRVLATGPRTSPMISFKGAAGLAFDDGAETSGWPASLEAETTGGHHGYNAIFGTLAPKVTSIVVHLPDGEALKLTPVAWKGSRWVGLVLPAGVRISRAIAYEGDRELRYSVPFGDVGLNVWWRLDQKGPAQVTKSIGSGVVHGAAWRVTAEIGPWGYCYVYANGSTCAGSTASPEVVQRGTVVAPFSCLDVGSARLPEVGITAVAEQVREVVLKYSDGSTVSLPAVEVGGGRVLAYPIPHDVSVTGSREYGAGGQLVDSTPGAAWRC